MTSPEKLRRHIRILTDLARLAGEPGDLKRVLDHAVVQVARAVEIDHVKILRYRRETADLLIVAGMGWKEGVVGVAALSSDLRSPPGMAYQTGEAVVIDDYEKQGEFVLSEVLREHSIHALVNVPILLDSAAWGVLEIDSTKPRDFREDTVEFLRAAAALIGIAIAHQFEAELRLEAATEIVARGEAQRVLLREMQHRVKNNFQVILASIALQKRRIEGKDVHRALDHVANRISAISLAHDQLAPREDLHAVDLAAYLRALCASIEQQSEGVAVEIEADEVELSIDRAVPLGLILNEAATNSVKHAFGESGGRIQVRLASGIGYGEAKLTIRDNGHGYEKPSKTGSGLRLIASLAIQAGGEIEQRSGADGTEVSVTFPVIG